VQSGCFGAVLMERRPWWANPSRMRRAVDVDVTVSMSDGGRCTETAEVRRIFGSIVVAGCRTG